MPIIKTEDIELPYLTVSQIKRERDTFPNSIKSEPFNPAHVQFQQQDIKLEYGTPGIVIKPEPHIQRDVPYSAGAVAQSKWTPHPSHFNTSSEQLAVIKKLKRERYRMRRKARIAGMTAEEKEAKKEKKKRKKEEKRIARMGKEWDDWRAEKKEKRRLRLERRNLKWRLQGIGGMSGGVAGEGGAYPWTGVFGGVAARQGPGTWRGYAPDSLQPWRQQKWQLGHPGAPHYQDAHQSSMPNLESRPLPGQSYSPSQLELGWLSHYESAAVPQPLVASMSDDDSDSELHFNRISPMASESDNDIENNLAEN